VHATPSSQFCGVPALQPIDTSQVSTPSQAAPLLQSVLSAMWAQPSNISLHMSFVQPMPSSQGEPEPAVHPVPGMPIAGLQTSMPVQ
jgi:hypothetical protein